MKNFITHISGVFRKKQKAPDFLTQLSENRGHLWEKINHLKETMGKVDGAIHRRTDKCEEHFPLTHHFNGGLYTREVFLPKGSVIVSLIHKQAHPSFMLQGIVSYLDDSGMIKDLKTGDKVFTEVGAQRVIYAKEDTRWCCVYKTTKTDVEEAEDELFTEDYLDLPKSVIKKYMLKNK